MTQEEAREWYQTREGTYDPYSLEYLSSLMSTEGIPT